MEGISDFRGFCTQLYFEVSSGILNVKFNIHLIIIYLQSTMRNILFETNGLTILMVLMLLIEPAALVAPVWVTSPYVQAGSNKVINGDACNCAVGNNVTPTTTIVFVTPFTTVPHLAFGISSYIAQDSLYNQKFQVNRTNLTPTSFRIAVQIRELTQIWTLEVRYIAISKDFPHHLNNFDNVPINYTYGALRNISSYFDGQTVFRNTINYTNQANAAGESNNKFSLPLSNNKILLFLTSLFIEEGNNYNNGVYLRIQTQILSTTTYSITARFSRRGYIEKLHFSMIIFDENDIQSSGKYILVYNQITFGVNTGFYAFPSQFLNNFMVGFLCFQSSKLTTTLNFRNSFLVNGTYGMSKAVSNRRGRYDPVLLYTFNIFYLKTWICPNGTFLDHATSQCNICTINQCTLCLSNSVCLACNITNYYYLSGSTCMQCDPRQNNFYNNSTLLCQSCSLTGCLNCSSTSTCEVCDQVSGYILNQTTRQCYKCPSNLFPNMTSLVCQTCTLSQCIRCSTLVTCSICNINNSYYLSNGECIYCDPTRNQFININSLCQNCSLLNCLKCSSLFACSVCNISNNYLLNQTDFLCYKCQIDNCISCLNFSSCSICDQDAGYILNQTTGLCSKCPPGLFPNLTQMSCDICTLKQCISCKTLSKCQICNANNSFYLSGSTCQFCNHIENNFINFTTLSCQSCQLDNCVICSSLTSCSLCNQTSRHVLNQSSLKCQECPANLFPNSTSLSCQSCTLTQCIQCSSLYICKICNTSNSYYLNGSTCSYCNPIYNQFINSSTLMCQACILSNCITCLSLQICLICDASVQYFLNPMNSLCELCTIPNCLNCSSLTTCYQCNQSEGYYLNSTSNLCQLCSLTGCTLCESLQTCLVCDSSNNYGLDFTTNRTLCGPCNKSCDCDGYTTPWISSIQSCTPLCGDGLIRLGQQCDDNNTDSGDGCSSSCHVEEYFVCDRAEPTSCNQTLFVQAELISILQHKCNEFKVSIKLTPEFSPSQIMPIITFINHGIVIKDIFDNNGAIQVVAQYLNDIAEQTIQLKFTPGAILNITYNPKIPALRYNQEQCNAEQDVKVFLTGVQIGSYIVLLLSLLSCKIIGLQLFGILQLSYFTLTMQDFYVIYLAPLAKFRIFNGLNILFTQQKAELPQNFTKLSVATSFINNCNIMLILMFGLLLFSGFLYFISKFVESQKLKKVALWLLKQGFITLVLFNIFNISYSAGVHWKYASPQDENYILSSVILYGTLIAVVLATFAIQIFSQEDYGEFRKKFKKVWICKSYITLTIIYRIFLGLYTALKSDYNQGTLLILASTIAFMLYNISNFPFSQIIHNYRGTFCHITMSFILLTSNYYRGIKMNTPIQIKGRQYTAAKIQLILIAICLIFSFITLVYEFYKMIKDCRKNKIIIQNTEESIEGFTTTVS